MSLNGQIVDRCQGKTVFFFHSNLYDGVVAEEEHCQKHTQTEIIFVHLLDKLDKCK